jgi:hypothetical protein
MNTPPPEVHVNDPERIKSLEYMQLVYKSGISCFDTKLMVV